MEEKVYSWYCEVEVKLGIHCQEATKYFYATQDMFMTMLSLCPACLLKHYPETAAKVLTDQFKSALAECEFQYTQTAQSLKPAKIDKNHLTMNLRTQKAKGILELRSTVHGKRILNQGLEMPQFIVIQSIADFDSNSLAIAAFFNTYKYNGVFARPCPITPRHGFLDSRKVKSIDEAKNLFQEMIKVDEMSELILMPLIEATHNSVVTSTIASIGIGHDGATSGHKALTLPVHGTLSYGTDKTSITQEAYLESVYSKEHTPCAVQLRDGPKLPRSKDIIREQVTVTKVIDIDLLPTEEREDLLLWEQNCQRWGRENKGLVIFHSNGCIGSHFCVHAVLNNIPFITTAKPQIGQVLEPTQEKSDIDFREVKKGLELGLSKKFADLWADKLEAHGTDSHSMAFKPLIIAALYCLHGYTVATKAESKLIGLGISNLIRLSICAALGEARHHKGLQKLQGGMYRDKVYKKYFNDVIAGIKKLQVTEQIFLDGSWSDSYGGKRWASCTRATLKLVNKAIVFCRKPEEKQFVALMGQFNKLVNEVHNGGKFLNKFISNNVFDSAAYDLALFVASKADVLYDFIVETRELKAETNSLSGMKQIRKMNKSDVKKLAEIIEATGRDDEGDERCHCPSCDPARSDENE